MTHHTEQTSDGFHLWLTTEMYVPLDRDGYVSNDVPCLEGSMDYVIQTFNHDDPSVRYAWKTLSTSGRSNWGWSRCASTSACGCTATSRSRCLRGCCSRNMIGLNESGRR